MAIKILTTAMKKNLSLDDLISYENKLREEVSRREKRFKTDDKYFKERSLKYQETLNERNYDVKFPNRRAGDMDEVKKGIHILEKTIKSKSSTKSGRKEILDMSFASYNSNLQGKGEKPISRRAYNKLAKFFDRLDELAKDSDIAAYFNNSEVTIDIVNEGLDFDTFVDTIKKMDEINEGYKMPHYSIEMIKDFYKANKNGEEKDLEEIFRKYSKNTSESNE